MSGPGTNKSGFLARMGLIMNRALASVSYRVHVATANLWRDGYNPLRSLTIARAVHLLEEGERGAYADLQWTYRYIEMQDATIGALIERRTSAIQKLDWDVKLRDDVPAGKQAIAKRQHEGLKAAYDRLNNLSAALEALAVGSFRGFAHLEKIEDDAGEVIELAPVDQWFWCREGLYGKWTLNRDSKFGLTRGDEVDLSRFIIREVSRPVNRVALIAFIRKSLSQKDWDGFIETYGIPAVFVIMPPDIPSDKTDEYLDAAEQVTSDARGVLPGGSDIKTVDNGARGNNPFKEHLAYQDEQIVMRGTGGLLTMLTQSGSGTLAGGAHEDTFEAIAQAESMEISEIMRKQFDAAVIERLTPGEPAYAYFELAANEETDTSAIVKDLRQLAAAGFRVDPGWVEEKTGYALIETQDARQDPASRLNPGQGGEGQETEEDIRNRYDPTQARADKGQQGGGRWIKAGSGSAVNVSWSRKPSADVREAIEKFFNAFETTTVEIKVKGSDYFEFRAETGGEEPYYVEGSIWQDEWGQNMLEVSVMAPIDKTASFTGSSRGVGMLSDLVDAASVLELKEIRTEGGKGGDLNMTGYRTWPALGFDYRYPKHGQMLKDSMPEDVKHLAGDPPGLLALTSTREGRLWWRKNGEREILRFDLTEGSASRARLEQVKERLAK